MEYFFYTAALNTSFIIGKIQPTLLIFLIVSWCANQFTARDECDIFGGNDQTLMDRYCKDEYVFKVLKRKQLGCVVSIADSGNLRLTYFLSRECDVGQV